MWPARIVALPEENRAALLFGSERYGLGTEDLNHCNVLVRIPANPEYCSLNLAMSVQLLAYEIFMAREQPQSRIQLELPLAPWRATSSIFTRTCTRCWTKSISTTAPGI